MASLRTLHLSWNPHEKKEPALGKWEVGVGVVPGKSTSGNEVPKTERSLVSSGNRQTFSVSGFVWLL